MTRPAQARAQMRPMCEADIERVMAIETRVYPYPWTPGNFRDSLRMGYECRVLEQGDTLVGYWVVMIAAGEAHLLNISVAAEWQRHGFGRLLLDAIIQLARERQADKLLLEVRPSNTSALALYQRAGFRRIGLRRAYYPAADGREDAVVMELPL